jgi:hypothetical protein
VTDLGQLAFGPGERWHEPQFVRTAFAFAAEKRDPTTVGGPHRAVVVTRVGGEPQLCARANLLDVDIRVIAVQPGPGERDLIAVG